MSIKGKIDSESKGEWKQTACYRGSIFHGDNEDKWCLGIWSL